MNKEPVPRPKVVEIRKAEPAINTTLVGDLNDLVTAAESGELVTLLYVCGWNNGSTSASYNFAGGNLSAIIGELEVLKTAPLSWILESEDEDG